MALLPTNKRDQTMLLIGIVAIAAAALYWYFVWEPNNVRLSAVQAHIDSLEVVNRKAKGELAKGSVQDLRAQAERYRQHLEVMRQLVPTSNEVPALLDQVSTAARRVGLDLGAVEPEPVIVGDQFDTYRYKMALFGTYHDVGEFLTNVGSLTRIIAPINLTLTPVSNQQVAKTMRRKGEQIIEVRFQIQTYVAKAPAPQIDRSRPARSGN
jgi:type IV pilus assembly protein PilO